MPTTFEQELTREQAAVTIAEQIKDNIKTVAENKGLTVEETDTPLSVLTKIDNSTIATPTETISITENGTVDVTNYASADVNVPSSTELPAYMSAKNFTFDGNACTGYVGDNSLPEIIIPKSYSTVTTTETLIGVKVLNKNEIRHIIRDFISVTFSDGENNTHIYSSPMELDKLENDFPNDCYLVSMEGFYTFSFDFLQVASDMQILQFPITVNGQSFSDGMTAFDYIMQNDITNVNFDGEVEVTKFVDGDDYKVTSVSGSSNGSGFKNYQNRIILLNNLTSIGDYAFQYCNSLTSIEIPSSVTSIGRSAFGSCSNLTSIDIPNNVTNIGDQAFSYCSNLTNIKIPSSVTSIGDEVFRGCSSLTSITIPDSVTSIGSFAFCDCSSLTSIIIPDSVTVIHDWAFGSCFSLTSITIGKGVTKILEYAFNNCSALVEIFNYSGLTINIGETSYSNNGYLGQYAKVIHNLSDGDVKPETIVKVIGNIQYYEYADDFIVLAPAVSRSSLTTVELDDRTTEINRFAFYETSLRSITIPSTVTSIGNYAIYNCDSLISITIPDTVTSIGDFAFSFCDALKTVAFGANSQLESIGDAVFNWCPALTSIEIPSGVTSIGDNAFSNCSSLITITVLVETPPTIQTNTFRNVPNTTIYYVPDASVDAYKTATNWSRYADQIQPLSEKGE